MDPSFIDDYHATQNHDRTIRHARRASPDIGPHAEAWRAMLRGLARRYPTHRKDQS